jgi:hypothetical protein
MCGWGNERITPTALALTQNVHFCVMVITAGAPDVAHHRTINNARARRGCQWRPTMTASIKEVASIGMLVVVALLFLALSTNLRPSAIAAVPGDEVIDVLFYEPGCACKVVSRRHS